MRAGVLAGHEVLHWNEQFEQFGLLAFPVATLKFQRRLKLDPATLDSIDLLSTDRFQRQRSLE
jgi:hypothetical protein